MVKDIAEEFIEKFVQKAEGLRLGDPLSDDIDIGPLVNANAIANPNLKIRMIYQNTYINSISNLD